jgi:UDP-glucose 4-epimerase
VRQIIDQIKNHTGLEFRVEETDRRVGDPAVLVASSAKIQQELGWQANRDLPTIISSAWDWHKEHLWGYDGKR